MQTEPIATSDAAAMFRRRISRNDRPYDAINKGWNNKRVDRWKAELLDKVARDGKLRPEIVMSLWRLYETGVELHQILANANTDRAEEALEPVEEKEVGELRAFFEAADCDALHQRGKFYVKRAWDRLMYHFFRHQMLVLHEHLYRGTTDPHEWYSRHLSGRDLFAEPITPFWTREQYGEIISTVMPFLAFQTGPSDR